MGRELKRVALDFDWPLKEVWKGFINPHFKPCPADNVACWGGQTSGGRWLDVLTRFLNLIGSQAAEEPQAEQLRARGQIFPHPYLEEFPTAPRFDMPRELRGRGVQAAMEFYARNPPKLIPLGQEMLDFIGGLAGATPEPGFFGRDLTWPIQKRLRELAGLPEDFGTCKVCKGEGIDPAVKEVYEAWGSYEPPVGEGWQVWETVSEGSPVTPVFATPDALINHLVTKDGVSRAAAERFVREVGYAPSMISIVGKDRTEHFQGIESVLAGEE